MFFGYLRHFKCNTSSPSTKTAHIRSNKKPRLMAQPISHKLPLTFVSIKEGFMNSQSKYGFYLLQMSPVKCYDRSHTFLLFSLVIKHRLICTRICASLLRRERSGLSFHDLLFPVSPPFIDLSSSVMSTVATFTSNKLVKQMRSVVKV